MKLLFIHQNFPGQYRELLRWLIAQGRHEIVFLTQRKDAPDIPGLRIISYTAHHKPDETAYALSAYWEECAGNGYGAALAGQTLKAAGFSPDLILGHAGWGELTFMKEVWPNTPIIGLFEYYYRAEGGSVGFDPEYPASRDARFVMHARNAANFANIQTVDIGQCATRWQRNTFPAGFHDKLEIGHEGVPTDRVTSNPDAQVSLARLDRPLTRADEIITYVSRNMEPVRGFHIFMRALPGILEARPDARALIIGGNGASYGPKSKVEGGYRAQMEQELGHRIDWTRVHFLGRVPYDDYRKVLQISRCHVYLTVPFVLSWSLLEAMSMEATIVASDVAPVREVMEHGKTGCLVDFFDPQRLAEQVVDVLGRPQDYGRLGKAARQHVVETYDFKTRILPAQVVRMNRLLPSELHLDPPGAI